MIRTVKSAFLLILQSFFVLLYEKSAFLKTNKNFAFFTCNGFGGVVNLVCGEKWWKVERKWQKVERFDESR